MEKMILDSIFPALSRGGQFLLLQHKRNKTPPLSRMFGTTKESALALPVITAPAKAEESRTEMYCRGKRI
jgi:hypothetical protein